LTGGTLGDLYGRRRIFLVGVTIFAAGTFICAVAPSAAALVLGRGVTGLGAALELPVALAILNVTYPDARKRAAAIAIWGGMNGLAMAIGPTLGGVLVDIFGWRSLFWAILPVAAVTGALAIAHVPESSDPHSRRLDWLGQIFIIITLAALCFSFIEGPKWGWHSSPIIVCFAASLIAVCLFLLVEYRSASPLVPLRVFSNGAFSASIANAALMTFGMYGLLFVLPLFLQSVRGEPATRAGIELLPLSATFFVISLIAGKAANAWGPRILISTGMFMTGIGLFALASIGLQSSYWIIAAALFAIGIGLGLITGPIATVAVANAPAERSGMSSGLVNVGRMVGATLGVAILGVIFGPRIEEVAKDAPQFLAAMRVAFLTGGAAQLVGAAIALAYLKHDSLSTKFSTSPASPQSATRGSIGANTASNKRRVA
jgi:DHA2 family methylenomycin A resistance protein-like MFS transporter